MVCKDRSPGAPRASVIAASILGLAFNLAQQPAFALVDRESTRHPSAVSHLPPFISPPGQSDVLLVVMALVLVVAVLAVGVFFFWLHSLPERLVHKSAKVHFDIVAALALLALFTHIHLFWVAALLLALVKVPVPDFTGLLGRIAGSLEKIADATPARADTAAPASINSNAPKASEATPARNVIHA
jgi:hypothetical protein